MDCRPVLGTPRAMKINFFRLIFFLKTQEMRKIQSFLVKESVFNDKHVKTIYDLKLNYFEYCSITFEVQRGFLELQLVHP